MVVFVFAKIATKWAMVRMLQGDDAIMIVAMVRSMGQNRQTPRCPVLNILMLSQFFAVGHCIAESLQVQFGLGRLEKSVGSHDFISYEKVSDYRTVQWH